MDRKYDLEKRLIVFTVSIINVVERLPNNRIGNHIAGQLLRSGTAPAPNYAEAQGAESRKDFIHKIKIALKELRETRIWLLVIIETRLIQPVESIEAVLGECQELILIFATSARTAEAREKQT